MELIDKKGKINKVTFKQIIEKADLKPIRIFSDTFNVLTHAANLLVDLFTLDVPNDASFEMHIEVLDNDFVFTGKDFNWFLRLERLSDLSKYLYGNDVFGFSKEDEAKPAQKIKSIKSVISDTTVHYIAVASTKDPENPIVNDFSGTKSECVKWLNQQIVQNATLENEVDMLICLDATAADPEWKTLKELFDEGKIDIC